MKQSVGEIIRKAENDYLRGTTQISKYVSFSMHDTIETIEAYLNSKHVSGDRDSRGREKPFFNIVIAAANVWMRATDIDRADIKIRATSAGDVLKSFIATLFLRKWMREAAFGTYLNDWGRTLARYGSAVTKIVEANGKLTFSVVPWNRLICDPVDFDQNPVIEVLELTEGQLRERIQTKHYRKDQVDALCEALETRTTLDKQRKDNKSGYIKVYELHGYLPKSPLTGKDEDDDTFVQQVHVISFVGKRDGRKTEYQDFTLYSGEEKENPYRKDDLIEEDGRTLAVGAVEHLMEPQWMLNHSMKANKDALDAASKLMFQTADANFAGRNILSDIEHGDIFTHAPNGPLTKVDTAKVEVGQFADFGQQWKAVGNEIVGISEAMLGVAPKSGTAWHQTEAVLNESYSLFELMTENKALALEDMLRARVIPYLKRTALKDSKELAATLEDAEITKIDARYIRSKSVQKAVKKEIVDKLIKGELPTQEGYQQALDTEQASLKDSLSALGNQRFFAPSELGKKTWEKALDGMEWDLEIAITDEERDTKDALTTLNTALQVVVNPAFATNPKAQAIVGRILEMTGAMSPVEYASLPDAPPAPPVPARPIPTPAPPTGDTAGALSR